MIPRPDDYLRHSQPLDLRAKGNRDTTVSELKPKTDHTLVFRSRCGLSVVLGTSSQNPNENSDDDQRSHAGQRAKSNFAHVSGSIMSQITLRSSASNSIDIASPVSTHRSLRVFFGNAPKILGRIGA